MTRAIAALWHGEIWLGCFAISVALALIVQTGGSALSLATMSVATAYSLVLWKCEPGSRARLLAGYGVVFAGYSASAILIDALRLPVRSETVLSFDRMLFGETPAVWLSSFRSPWLGEILTAGYLSYLIYLHMALFSVLASDSESRARWMRQVWGVFAVGLAGYFLFPASSPNRVFPELFSRPLAGGFLTHANEALNTAAAARYDAFPSLHVLVTLTLLHLDWHEKRGRFWVMLAPATVLIVSTMALRLHYAVDVLVAAALFLLFCVFWRFHAFIAGTR